MPNIHVQTNLTIDAAAEAVLKEKLGKAIETLPGKSERWLMLELDGNKTMYFQGSAAPCALAHVELFGKATDAVYEKMTEVLTEILSDTLSLSPDRIYTKYSEFTHWGWNGQNF